MNPRLPTARSLSRARLATTGRLGRGQSLVEFALVVPILLLVFAICADLGRAFYAYVSIENGVKEGALFGSRTPLCVDDTSAGCRNPRNVVWRVRNELATLRNPDGSPLVPTVACIDDATGTARTNMRDCAPGDRYEVSLTYPFAFITPILGQILGGTLNLGTSSTAVVLNQAFDPTPGLSIQKLVKVVGSARNEAEIVANCLEPDDYDSEGYYRSPCTDSGTPANQLYVTFQSGDAIDYKLTVANSGGVSLTSVAISDSTGPTGCSYPSTMPVGWPLVQAPCYYSRTAPKVPVGQPHVDYANVVTGTATQIGTVTETNTVRILPAPPKLAVTVYVSPYALGDDGDGNNGTPAFSDTAINVGWNGNATPPDEAVWFQVNVTNVGDVSATGVQITSSLGALPFGTNSPSTAVCPAAPASLNPAATFTCRYWYDITAQGVIQNVVTATASNAVPSQANASASVNTAACSGSDKVIPNLISLTKTNAIAAWTAAGFTSTLGTWNGNNSAQVKSQNVLAFLCRPASTAMTVTK